MPKTTLQRQIDVLLSIMEDTKSTPKAKLDASRQLSGVKRVKPIPRASRPYQSNPFKGKESSSVLGTK